MGMYTGYTKSKPLDVGAHIHANLITLYMARLSDRVDLSKAIGLLTDKEARAFLAVSDRLIENVKLITINDQETEPLDNPS